MTEPARSCGGAAPQGTGSTSANEEWPVSSPRPRIPEATVARLAVYLRVLTGLADGGRSNVSSGELASAAGVNPAGLRKDLSHLGPCGVRGVGYEVATLRDRIARVLGVERSRPCVLVGIGNLGTALADYAGFGSRGFRFVGLFDAAPARVGQRIGGQPVRPMAELDEVVAATGATIGVVATPADVAQSVCDRLTAAGVRSILNFAPVALSAPDGVDVRQVDLSVELQVLAFLGQQRNAYALARDQGTVGRAMHPVAQRALRVGKRVHSETGIDKAGASLVSVSLDRAEERIGELAGRPVLVVGAGSMGALAATTLARRGAAVTVSSRTTAPAGRLAASVGGRAAEPPGLPAEVAAADVLVTCTGARGLVVGTEVVARAMAARPERPLVIIDLALPRDVDPGVAALPGVHVVDLALLQGERTAGLLGDGMADDGTPTVAADDIAAAHA